MLNNAIAIVDKRMGNLEMSLDLFEKAHKIIPENTDVIFQIADMYVVLILNFSFYTLLAWCNWGAMTMPCSGISECCL